MKLFLFFLLAVVSADPDSFITNGKEAKIEDFPYQASLVNLKSGKFGCGGSIISNIYILTAAHCIVRATPENVFVSLGSADFTKGIRKNVHRIVFHSEYESDGVTAVNDIGLIKTDHIDFSDKIQSIALPNEDDLDKNFETEDANISGWGYTETNGHINQFLLYADVKIMNQDECAKQYEPGIINETHICADGEGGASVCYGDSGGPLVLKSSGILIGITSFGLPDCGFWAVFTRVTKYRDWILENSGV